MAQQGVHPLAQGRGTAGTRASAPALIHHLSAFADKSS